MLKYMKFATPAVGTIAVSLVTGTSYTPTRTPPSGMLWMALSCSQ